MFIERMKKMKLHTLLHSIAPFLQEGDFENPEIQALKMIVRKVTSGALFICIKGYTVDGHDFAEAAVRKGAVAVLAEKELSLNVPVVIVKDTKRAMALLQISFMHILHKNYD